MLGVQQWIAHVLPWTPEVHVHKYGSAIGSAILAKLDTQRGVAQWLAEFVAWTKLTHVGPG